METQDIKQIRELALVEVEVRGGQEPNHSLRHFFHLPLPTPHPPQRAHKRCWSWNQLIRSEVQVGRRPERREFACLLVSDNTELSLLSLRQVLSLRPQARCMLGHPHYLILQKRNGGFYDYRISKKKQACGCGSSTSWAHIPSCRTHTTYGRNILNPPPIPDSDNQTSSGCHMYGLRDFTLHWKYKHHNKAIAEFVYPFNAFSWRVYLEFIDFFKKEK